MNYDTVRFLMLDIGFIDCRLVNKGILLHVTWLFVSLIYRVLFIFG